MEVGPRLVQSWPGALAGALHQAVEQAEHDAHDREDEAEGSETRNGRRGGGEDQAGEDVEHGREELDHDVDRGLQVGGDGRCSGPPFWLIRTDTRAMGPGAGFEPASPVNKPGV